MIKTGKETLTNVQRWHNYELWATNQAYQV